MVSTGFPNMARVADDTDKQDDLPYSKYTAPPPVGIVRDQYVPPAPISSMHEGQQQQFQNSSFGIATVPPPFFPPPPVGPPAAGIPTAAGVPAAAAAVPGLGYAYPPQPGAPIGHMDSSTAAAYARMESSTAAAASGLSYAYQPQPVASFGGRMDSSLELEKERIRLEFMRLEAAKRDREDRLEREDRQRREREVRHVYSALWVGGACRGAGGNIHTSTTSTADTVSAGGQGCLITAGPSSLLDREHRA